MPFAPDARVPFILECDRGKESGPRLAEKLPGYRRLLSVAVSPTCLLFCFESIRREVEARRALANGPHELATAALTPGQSPANAIWLPLESTLRLSLVQLRLALLRATRP